ncbi:MAG: methionine synthase [Promethearchaeota archaeon]
MKLDDKSILGACLQDCIHVAGILNFFQIAESMGYKVKFLGPAVKIHRLINEIAKSDAGIIGLSYRLTPKNGLKYLKEFIQHVRENGLDNRKYYLGCLPDLVKKAKTLDFFDEIFTGGETIEEIIPRFQGILAGDKGRSNDRSYPDNLLDRIRYKSPYPILRAHFGLPSMSATLSGISEIAEANVLDVISIAPDQAAQEFLHRPEQLKMQAKGSGGAPIRSRQDLIDIYKASRRGNYPLLRIYSGTQDLVKNAALFNETIKNAWAAIPIFWYSELDGRGPSKLLDAIVEHRDAIKWHAIHDIPVEINDPHQWGLRMAPDHIVVADAFLCANFAKNLGVKTYIEQIMFNTPPGNNFKMDLARALAMVEIVQPLIDDQFRVLKQSRAGLAYFSPRQITARGQLCASTMIQMAIKPHIMHVVSFCEGDHAATPKEIIESSQLISRIIQDSFNGLPDLARDPEIVERKNELLRKACILLKGIKALGDELGIENAFTSPKVLHESVRRGLMDAPQLVNNPVALGKIQTRIINGKCCAVDASGSIIDEKERLSRLGIEVDADERLSLSRFYKNIKEVV